jgi:HEAT repeat protein
VTFDLAAMMRAVLAVVLVSLGLLLLLVVVHRFTANLLAARRDRLAQRSRPLLLAVLADDSPDPAALDALATLPASQWRILEVTLVGMLGKVRGGARDSLVDVLAKRGTLDRATARTRSRSWLRRCQAAEMLGAARLPGGVPTLVELLRDRHVEVRQVAARALGRVGAKEAVPALSTAVTRPEGLSMREVASALVMLEPDATASIIGVAAEARDPQVRAMAAEVLGLRGAVEATGPLMALLADDPDTEVRIRSARALGRIGARAAAGPLIVALEAEAPELRAVAARALGQVGAADAVDALVRRLCDPWHRVASNAADALALLGACGVAALGEVAASGRTPAAGYAEQALATHALGRELLERSG